jgi:uncharacterized surface anchored protein
MAFIDIYTVGYSLEFELTGREEKTENLNLTQNPVGGSGNLTGTVTSGGAGVSGATVKVYDINDIPVEHTNTGGNGQYTVANLPAGSYKVTAVKDGFLLPLPTPVVIQSNKAATVNIALTPDPEDSLNVVYGIINSSSGAPLENAIVSLYEDTQPEPALFISASTNNKGQYIFGLIPPGSYFVTATKLGYFPGSTAVFSLGVKNIVGGNIALLEDTQANRQRFCKGRRYRPAHTGRRSGALPSLGRL